MSEQADRDALAEIILRTHEPGFANVRGSRLRDTLLDQFREVADAILASDWLAQRDRRVAAEAWDDGFKAGQGSMLVSAGGEPRTNPHRADQIEAGER